MNILFPSSPSRPRIVDQAFEKEAEAAEAAGFGTSLVDLEILLGGEVKFVGLPKASEELGARDILYRGWLMKPEQYRSMALKLDRRLVIGPVSYEISYNLPQWYSLFTEGATPRTLVIPGRTFDLGEVAEKVYDTFRTRLSESQQAQLKEVSDWNASHIGYAHPHDELLELPGPRPVIVKDYLKSAKHRWWDACFIPDCRDQDYTKRITKNFLENQGEDLTGGLCFREFVQCKRTGTHSKTRQPLVNEWRAFLVYGHVIYLCLYWAEGDYTVVAVPTAAEIEELCSGLKELPLVAVDIGEKDNGGWVVFEVNDGGSAGVPDGGNTQDFYQALSEAF